MQEHYLKAIKQGRSDIFYNSRTWRKQRLKILERDNYECQRCKKQGRASKAEVAHHIKELKDRPDLGMEKENLTSLCFDCHNIVHERFGASTNKIEEKIPEKW